MSRWPAPARWKGASAAECIRGKKSRAPDHRDVKQPVAEVRGDAIKQIIHRLDEIGADSALTNFGRDLPFVFGRRDQVVEKDGHHEIEDHRREVVAGDRLPARVEYRAPDEDHSDERDDSEDRAQQKIPAIDEGVLQADVEELPIFQEAARDGF